jgi:RNA-directed DNA polymerase
LQREQVKRTRTTDAYSQTALPNRRKSNQSTVAAGILSIRRIAPKANARFKERIRELTIRTRGISLAKIVAETATYLRGWLGYFGECQTPSVLKSLESWLCRRLRSVVWKQWKRGRTRFKDSKNFANGA